MKLTDLGYLIPLLGSGGLTYGLVTETNGSQLKKENPTVYNDLQANPDSLKTKITEAETELATLNSDYETEKTTCEAMAEGDDKEIAEMELKQKEIEVVKKQEEVSLYQGVESYGIGMPILSLPNIGKSLGVFAFLALVLCLISKKGLELFNNKDN